MRDLANNIDIKRVISPVSEAGNTALVGQVINSQGYGSLTYVIATGDVGDAGAEFTALLEEDTVVGMTSASAVADADLHGTEALTSFTQADDNKVFKLGYHGTKPFTRLTITPANNATAALIGAFAILGHPLLLPTANPPA